MPKGKNKVARLIKTKFHSATILGNYGDIEIYPRLKDFFLEYNIGRKTVPKFGCIYAFEFLNDAESWANTVGDYGLRIVAGSGKRIKGKAPRDCFNLRHRVLDEYIAPSMIFGLINKQPPIYYLPSGTVTLEWFKPTRVVKWV